MERSDEIMTSPHHDSGESSTRGQRRRRRRPLHATSYLLLASSSLCLASASDTMTESKKQTNLRTRILAGNSDLCPAGYAGKVPTAKCAGYVSCTDGKPTGAVQLCAAGTQFDIKSSTCTWPDKVDCKVGNELIGVVDIQDDSGGSDGTDGDNGEPEVKFCPERYTGRAPTQNCKGYVQCTRGQEGISANCPPRTKFSIMTNLCEYNLEKCEMLVGKAEEDTPYVGVNTLSEFCPDSYTGRAPTKNCEGYVDCKDGVARRSKQCPSGTKFDAMILACTYSSSGCDVLEALEPTLSPLTQMESKQTKRFEGCDGQPENFVGYLAEPGCESYIYCQLGKEVNRFECADGTLYNGQYCTWADTVSCDDTKIPTISPSEEPTPSPTEIPTYTPTELDMADTEAIYYPKFSDGTCRNDGLFPPNVGHQYLFNSADRCCNAYFPTNLEKCLNAAVPTPPPTPDGKPEWFPDYQTGICKNDDSHSDFETNFFWTYEECCHFDWIPDTVKCLRNRPSVAYYPDYERDACLSDGKQSPFEMNLFQSMEECCRFKWIDYGLCINGGRKVDDGDDDEVEMNLGFEYYPDQDHNVCNCDGKQSIHEINIFSSYEECCQFSLIDTTICLQYKMYIQDTCVLPAMGEPVWYPDRWNGLCRNDGLEPQNVDLTTSYQECCKRFFPGTKQDCRAKSEAVLNGEFWGPSPTPEGPPCTGLRPRQCSANSECRYDIGLDKCVTRTTSTQGPPSPTPANSKSCSDLPKRLCSRESSCTWGIPDGPCFPASAPITGPSNPAAPLLSTYCNPLPKKVCVRESRCAWQKPSGPCIAANDDIGNGSVPAPGPPEVAPNPSKYSGNPFYADYMNNICLNDGRHRDGDDTFETVVDCCRDPWVEFKTCIKHARNTGMVDGEEDDSGGGDDTKNNNDEPVYDPPTNSNSHPYYPDYFYNVCRNDGNQSPMEANLFDKLMDCCRVRYIDYDSCMSNAES